MTAKIYYLQRIFYVINELHIGIYLRMHEWSSEFHAIIGCLKKFFFKFRISFEMKNYQFSKLVLRKIRFCFDKMKNAICVEHYLKNKKRTKNDGTISKERKRNTSKHKRNPWKERTWISMSHAPLFLLSIWYVCMFRWI